DIHTSGNYLLNVINDILDMSKIESGNFEITAEPFDLPQLMTQCVQMMQLKADEGGIKLVVDLADNMPEVIGDKRSYRQIVLN
ncbi:sensor histidine kinase, partial [Klebsiella aerogenes]|uniref:sensor histidine kinase n=1 Tax=Klebsiella aerogenes TaxID=548 RepID=UPI0034D1CD2D